jgi:hypothetical protein
VRRVRSVPLRQLRRRTASARRPAGRAPSCKPTEGGLCVRRVVCCAGEECSSARSSPSRRRRRRRWTRPLRSWRRFGRFAGRRGDGSASCAFRSRRRGTTRNDRGARASGAGCWRIGAVRRCGPGARRLARLASPPGSASTGTKDPGTHGRGTATTGGCRWTSPSSVAGALISCEQGEQRTAGGRSSRSGSPSARTEAASGSPRGRTRLATAGSRRVGALPARWRSTAAAKPGPARSRRPRARPTTEARSPRVPSALPNPACGGGFRRS